MNRRLLLLIVLVTLGAVAWFVADRNGPSTLDRPLSDFAIADTASITRIHITDLSGKVVDLKRTNIGWTLNDTYRAKQFEVSVLLNTFKRVEVKSPVPKSAHEQVMRVMGAASRKVEIYQGGDVPTKIWIVGHGTKDHFGTYMVLEKPGEGRSNAPFILGMGGFTGILNTRFHTKLDSWRSGAFYAYTDMRDLASVTLETPLAPANSYTLAQTADGRFSLLDHLARPYAFDTVLVHGAILPLKEVNFETIQRRSKASQDSLLRNTPNHVLSITARDGTISRAKLWYRPYTGSEPAFGAPRPLYDPLYMDALVQDTLVVIMQRTALERILQPISAFRP